ncbi:MULTISPECIES: 4-alpha-glucanotransferase [Rhodomicrobium]|uniref:4-alpha-glucanotransferase n=1 Tax=Rhodomicrobium TaxID=1068 RepID=UPI000B4B6878|nr:MULTISPECIES: 4-alpha-glucanotransferase [Rhodomicrobium]
MSAELDRLAEAHGIGLAFVDEMGRERVPSDDAKRRLLTALGIAAETDEDVHASLAALEAPRCYIPPFLEDGRAWGITCQLYALRSPRNWGIGDFEDLARLAELGAGAGADFIGINPVHALFFADPSTFSPYTPSSRRFLNPLYIAIDGFPGLSDADRAALKAARDAELVDYPAIARLKRLAFEAQFKQFQADEIGTGSEQAHAFEAFSRERGERLDNFALFEALSENMSAHGLSCGWRDWPDEFRDKASGAVGLFRDQHGERIRFYKWLQWVAYDQLGKAQARALAAGMRIGLYLDLAVGVSPDGADTWSEPETILRGVRVGSPPDGFNAKGQDWGLAPISPRALAAERGRIFRELVADAIGPAGAFRIDHAMSMARLYLIADGLDGTDGAYVQFPFGDMLKAAGAASTQTRAVIIGEDLGTVPPNFRETMRENRIQGYRVLFFERDWNGDRSYLLPHHYERDALACISTHDLPTLRSWWEGADIDDRERIGLDDAEAAAASRAARDTDRRMMLDALAASGLMPDDIAPAQRGEQPLPALLPQSLAIALSRFLARTPCRLVAIQLEDLAEMKERMNIPGTVDEQPNWRRKFPLDLDALFRSQNLQAITKAVAEERPRYGR